MLQQQQQQNPSIIGITSSVMNYYICKVTLECALVKFFCELNRCNGECFSFFLLPGFRKISKNDLEHIHRFFISYISSCYRTELLRLLKNLYHQKQQVFTSKYFIRPVTVNHNSSAACASSFTSILSNNFSRSLALFQPTLDINN